MAELSYSFFAERLNRRFQLSAQSVALELIEASRMPAAVPGIDAYTLVFGGPLPPLPQATYTLESVEDGPFDVFLVPIASTGGAIHYEAVFN